MRGIFDGMEDLKDPKKKEACAKLMGEGYSIPASDALSMFADAHNTNWAENYQFFMNQNNPTNWKTMKKKPKASWKAKGSAFTMAIGNWINAVAGGKW